MGGIAMGCILRQTTPHCPVLPALYSEAIPKYPLRSNKRAWLSMPYHGLELLYESEPLKMSFRPLASSSLDLQGAMAGALRGRGMETSHIYALTAKHHAT